MGQETRSCRWNVRQAVQRPACRAKPDHRQDRHQGQRDDQRPKAGKAPGGFRGKGDEKARYGGFDKKVGHDDQGLPRKIAGVNEKGRGCPRPFVVFIPARVRLFRPPLPRPLRWRLCVRQSDHRSAGLRSDGFPPQPRRQVPRRRSPPRRKARAHSAGRRR